jgi:hypothetical protein
VVPYTPAASAHEALCIDGRTVGLLFQSMGLSGGDVHRATRSAKQLLLQLNREKAMKPPAIYTAAMATALAIGLAQHASSLDLGKKMAAACEAKAREMSWKMNISIVDSGANEIFLGLRSITERRQRRSIMAFRARTDG